jgi:hydroxyacylglutathione hydrolase
MTAQRLEQLIKQGRAPWLFDVRSGPEFRSGHIRGAVHAPFMSAHEAVARTVKSSDQQLVLTCEHGPRAQLARLLLRWRGHKNVELLEGHMLGWRRAGRAVVKC